MKEHVHHAWTASVSNAVVTPAPTPSLQMRRHTKITNTANIMNTAAHMCETSRNVKVVPDLDQVGVALRKGQSDPATPAGSQHSCQPTVKLHILLLVWNFPLGEG